MPGQAYGEAMASILFGERSPSAKLPVTFPRSEHQQRFSPAAYPGLTNGTVPIPMSCNFNCPTNGSAVFEEKLLVGYRWFDAHGETPRFCFGHGLTYGRFAFSALEVVAHGSSSATASFTLKNVGSVAASEVPQLYLSFPPAAGEPARQLKAFAQHSLAPGASTTVAFHLAPRDVSTWDAVTHAWKVESGEFQVAVGPSSCDLRLNGSFTLPHTADRAD